MGSTAGEERTRGAGLTLSAGGGWAEGCVPYQVLGPWPDWTGSALGEVLSPVPHAVVIVYSLIHV